MSVRDKSYSTQQERAKDNDRDAPKYATIQISKHWIIWRALRWSWRAIDATILKCRAAHFGERSSIDFPRRLVGISKVAIGDGVRIGSFARIEIVSQGSDGPLLTIGSGTVVQPYVHIGVALSIKIGHGVLIASHVYITDHDHDFTDLNNPASVSRRLLVAPTEIGDNTWLGERVVVLKGVRIGRGCIVGAGSVVTKDIPEFTMVAGAPARAIRRYSLSTKSWVREGKN